MTYYEIETVLSRIDGLRWARSGGLNSVHRLAEEYMRRQYFWAQALDTRWHWLSGLPFCIDENVKLTQEMQTVLASVPFPNVFMRLSCQLMLLWEMVTPPFDLPHPYEPLLVLYERGGVLMPEGKIVNSPFLMVGAAEGTRSLIMQPHLYEIETPFVSMDAAELDWLDGQGTI